MNPLTYEIGMRGRRSEGSGRYQRVWQLLHGQFQGNARGVEALEAVQQVPNMDARVVAQASMAFVNFVLAYDTQKK